MLADSFAAKPAVIGETQAASGDIILGKNCWIGARAVILSEARIGDNAVVGAAAVIDFEVPPFAIVAGNPARIVGWAKEGRGSHRRSAIET